MVLQSASLMNEDKIMIPASWFKDRSVISPSDSFQDFSQPSSIHKPTTITPTKKHQEKTRQKAQTTIRRTKEEKQDQSNEQEKEPEQ